MQECLINYLRISTSFECAYSRAKEYVRENINPYCDTLELSKDTCCDICFSITEDNLFILGLDKNSTTIWIFYNDELADFNIDSD